MEQKRPVTMRDVAKKAGVSVATVSRVLNSSGFVSEKLDKKVWAAVEALDYRPNALARGLKTQSTNTIGVVVSNIMNPFFTAMVRGIEDKANRFGYNIILCNTDDSEEKQERYLSVLQERRVDGIILAPAPGTRKDLPRKLRRIIGNTPTVFVDRTVEDIDSCSVSVDNVGGSALAVTHLLNLGHRRIGMITGPMNTLPGQERLEGYRQALTNYGVPIDPALIKTSPFRQEPAFERTVELVTMENRPTALFVANNLMAMGALKALQEMRISVPKELSFVAFDDPEWAQVSSPPLTTVSQPTYELGTNAMDLLERHMRQETSPNCEMILECELVVRGSCQKCG